MTIRDRIRRRLRAFRSRMAARTLGQRTRIAERLAPELIERLIGDKIRAQESARRADAWAESLRGERDAARESLEIVTQRLEEMAGGAPCSTCPIKAEAEQAREQRDMALRERDAAHAEIARLRAGRASDAQAYEDLRTASARERQALIVERSELDRRVREAAQQTGIAPDSVATVGALAPCERRRILELADAIRRLDLAPPPRAGEPGSGVVLSNRAAGEIP